MTICLPLKERNGASARAAKGKIGMELCPPSGRIVGRKKKKATGETGKAYETGFQITEVIPSVIDSPIATYRISLGSSWEGNYNGSGEDAPARWEERKREVCGVSGSE